MSKQTAFGLWKSSLSPKMMANNIQFEDVQWSGDTLIWKEQSSDWGALIAQKKGGAKFTLNTRQL